MTTEQWFEKATAYFGGNMNSEEEQLFEMETAADEELSQLMQFWRSINVEATAYEKYKEEADAFINTHHKLKNEFVNDVQDEIIIAGKKEVASVKKLRFSIWQWVAVAAAITGIIFMIDVLISSPKKNQSITQEKSKKNTERPIHRNDSSAILVQQNEDSGKALPQTLKNNVSSETLYAQAFTKDEIPQNYSGPLDDALFYYARSQYKNAISAIDNVDKAAVTRSDDSSPLLTDFYAHYYKGLSMMLLGNTAGAIELMQQAIEKSPGEELKVKPEWYLGLAYIKQNKYSLAEKTFEQLINNPSSGSYKNKAENLLAALKK